MRGDLKDATSRLSTAEQREQRRWRVVIGLAVSFAFDIILTVVVTIATVQAHTASERANATVAELRSTQLASCRSSNQTRAEQVTLWDHIGHLSIRANTPPKQRKADEALLAYIRHVFAKVNCAARYRLP
jgi:hypothetical protein